MSLIWSSMRFRMYRSVPIKESLIAMILFPLIFAKITPRRIIFESTPLQCIFETWKFLHLTFFDSTYKFKSVNMPKGAGLTKSMKLSNELGDIVGKKEASRAECIKQLWAYIKKHDLQDPENKQYFTPDKKNGQGFRQQLDQSLIVLTTGKVVCYLDIILGTNTSPYSSEEYGHTHFLIPPQTHTVIRLARKVRFGELRREVKYKEEITGVCTNKGI
ncbi:unnamed protein product [Lepeophtheirus salmonis]|uniref:(salmon louse) hypothetical protein n=1 Tax=Lepeophtheirus salmonis TaxID=72036 RepID=A0A7R8HCW6_LEPSM|nr:unnamed protein product [Lepeophtheirus salmonis]CAF3014879.1 unnamed protein product [Lepeophtheirus salmonis]